VTRLLIYFSFCIFLFSEENPWNDPFHQRVIHRKNVQHIVFDVHSKEKRLVILVSERFPYNYKGNSYPLYLPLKEEEKPLDIAEIWDRHLDSGKSISLKINGSIIVKYELN
jgi:hypothetical protein